MDSNIKYLLTYCQDKTELYNQVAIKLRVEFGIRSAEVSLLCTYMINEWRLKDGYRKDVNTLSDNKVGRSAKKAKDNTGRNSKDNRGEQVPYSEL